MVVGGRHGPDRVSGRADVGQNVGRPQRGPDFRLAGRKGSPQPPEALRFMAARRPARQHFHGFVRPEKNAEAAELRCFGQSPKDLPSRPIEAPGGDDGFHADQSTVFNPAFFRLYCVLIQA